MLILAFWTGIITFEVRSQDKTNNKTYPDCQLSKGVVVIYNKAFILNIYSLINPNYKKPFKEGLYFARFCINFRPSKVFLKFCYSFESLA